MIVVVILPFTQFLVEQMDVVADAILIEQLVELLVVDAVRPLHFAVQAGCAGPNVTVPDVSTLQVPMELRLEFCAVVGLHDMDAKWQTPQHLVDELDGGALVARVEDLEDPNPRAIVNGGELEQSPARAGNPLEELHVYLQPMPWRDLLVSLPAFAIRPMLLICRQTTHPVSLQNAMDRGSGDQDLMKAMQVRG